MLSFFLIHLGIETTETFKLPHSSLKNDTRFQTNMQAKSSFSDRNDTNIIPLGAAHTYMAYIRVYPPPPPEVSAKRVESPCCAFYHPRKKRKPCNLYIFVVRQVRKWVRVKRGKHRNSTRLAAMLKNKLQVFCCPFFQVQVSEV